MQKNVLQLAVFVHIRIYIITYVCDTCMLMMCDIKHFSEHVHVCMYYCRGTSTVGMTLDTVIVNAVLSTLYCAETCVCYFVHAFISACMYMTYFVICRCCTASTTTAPTCTNPITQLDESTRSDLCPSPPRVSVADVVNGTTGRLDSDLTYVDEVLLEEAIDLDPDVYIRRIQAGFVMSYRDPPYAACGCNSTDPTRFISSLEEVSVCIEVDGAPIYARQDLSWLDDTCPLSGANGGNGGDCDQCAISDDYLVDGSSANFLQHSLCSDNCSHVDRPVAAYTPNQTREQITATVYYNNNVSFAELHVLHYRHTYVRVECSFTNICHDTLRELLCAAGTFRKKICIAQIAYVSL